MENVALKLDPDAYKDHYRCDITESYVILEHGVCVKMYGLKMYNRNPYLARQDGEFCRVDAISDDRSEVERLRDLITEMDVYPAHLIDILEDRIS